MTTFRLFILVFLISLFSCGPKEDSFEGRFIIYSQQIEDNPGKPEGYYELGKLYIEQKKYPAALKQFNKATHLKKDYSEAYREKGITLFYLKQFQDAEKAILKSFRLNPAQPNIATDLGSIYLKNGNIKKAFLYLQVAKKRGNNLHIVFNNLGAAHAKKGENKEALKLWKQALKNNSSTPETYVNMGVVYEKTGQKKKALIAYQKALELDKSNAMAHYNLGVVYAKEKDFPKAVKKWESAFKHDAKDENTLNSLAWGYEKIGKKKEALIMLNRSIKLNPYASKTHFSSGRIKYDLGDSEGAIKSFKKATRLSPNFGDAYYRMGLTFDDKEESYDAISNLLIAEIIYHKTEKMDFFEKVQAKLNSSFEKYQTKRTEYMNIDLPEALKGYDINKRPKQIRTSKEK
jgi:tetratricopeptide (TPR) repeat protein